MRNRIYLALPIVLVLGLVAGIATYHHHHAVKKTFTASAYVPPAAGMYTSSDGVTWSAMEGVGSGTPLGYVPPATAMYYKDTATGNWFAWDGTGGGGGGGSSVGSAGQMQKVGATAGSFAASSLTDSGTAVTGTEPVTVPVVMVSGALGANQTSKGVMAFNAGVLQIISYGADTATAGDINLIGLSTNASGSISYISCSHAALGCNLGGIPTASTATAGSSNVQIANTSFVSTAIATASANYQAAVGPAVAPTGACTTGLWSFSQDGHASFCAAGTWTVKI